MAVVVDFKGRFWAPFFSFKYVIIISRRYVILKELAKSGQICVKNVWAFTNTVVRVKVGLIMVYISCSKLGTTCGRESVMEG